MSETITTPQFPLNSEWGRGIEPAEVLRLGRIIAQAEAGAFQRPDERVSFARMFCTSIVEVLWSRVLSFDGSVWPLPELFVPMTGLPKSSRLYSVAVAMGDAAGTLDLQSGSEAIGTTYTSLLPDSQRYELGLCSTSSVLVQRLLDMAACAGVNWRTCSVCDPACGSGAFLAPIAARMAEENKHVQPKMLLRALSQRLRGWDVDPFAAWLAQVFIELAVKDVCRKAGERLPIMVEVTDSLSRKKLEANYDLVIGNPPSGRITLVRNLRRRYRRSLYRHADSYGLFTDMALRLARRGGIVAYVTPAGFPADECFKALNTLLANEASPVNLDFASDCHKSLLATFKRGIAS
jgi:adenine-specific DNA-methyltransferase